MIQNYELYNPTRLIFGQDRFVDLQHHLPSKANILLLYGQGSIKKNGVYEKVIAELESYKYIEFGGIEPNPTYETLMKAVDLGRKEKIDFILAVGGGSVIDGAKFVAAAILFNEDPWTILSENAEVIESIPIGSILTLPATGSEMNRGSVISRKSTKEKFAFLTEKSFPKFSILDTSVLQSLPQRQIANGIVDAFIHTTEQYITYPINAKLQDRIAESILITLIEDGKEFYKDSSITTAGANIMYCATIALNGTIGAGVPSDWSIHMIGHELTALYGIDHARTLAAIMPAAYLTLIDYKIDKLVQFGERVWGIKEGSIHEKASEAILKTDQFFTSLGIPNNLSHYSIDLDITIKEIINRFKKRNILELGENGILKVDMIEDILKLAYKGINK